MTYNGAAIINDLNSTAPILQLESIDTTYHKFSVGSTETYSNSSNFTRNYFVKSSNNNIGTYIENNFTDDTFNLRTFTSTYDEIFMSVDLTNNNQRTTTFDKCASFTISSGAGSNGDCSLFIKADTDNAVETANPAIVLQQDILAGTAYVEGIIELNTDNNLKISITEGVGSGGKIVLDPDDEVNVVGVLNVDGKIKGADESMVFEVSGNETYFYTEKYSGSATVPIVFLPIHLMEVLYILI